jgi:hypothetical protein
MSEVGTETPDSVERRARTLLEGVRAGSTTVFMLSPWPDG